MTTPTTPTDNGGTIDRITAAEIMYGTGSRQHLAAIRRYGSR